MSSRISEVIDNLAWEIHENAVNKGFWEKRSIVPDADALIEDIMNRDWEPKVLDALPAIIGIIESHIKTVDRNDGECIALMASELSESLEALRHSNPPDKHCPEFDNASVELADCIIRILDFAAARELPLGDAMIAKMRYNQGREYKHGKRF